MVYESNYISHHGIKGQSWGVRNGPPYPLKRTSSGAIDTSRKKKKKASNDTLYGAEPNSSNESVFDTNNPKARKKLKKQVRYMDSKDIDELISRLNKEKNLKQLLQDDSSHVGEDLVKKLVATIGIPALTGVGMYLIEQAIRGKNNDGKFIDRKNMADFVHQQFNKGGGKKK